MTSALKFHSWSITRVAFLETVTRSCADELLDGFCSLVLVLVLYPDTTEEGFLGVSPKKVIYINLSRRSRNTRP